MSKNRQRRIPVERIDEIPTAPSAFKAQVVCVAVLDLAALAFPVWKWGADVLDVFLEGKVTLEILWERQGVISSLEGNFQAIGWVGLLCGLAGVIDDEWVDMWHRAKHCFRIAGLA